MKYLFRQGLGTIENMTYFRGQIVMIIVISEKNDIESDNSMKKLNRSIKKKEDTVSIAWFCKRSDNAQDVAHGDFEHDLDNDNFFIESLWTR